jgi:transposase
VSNLARCAPSTAVPRGLARICNDATAAKARFHVANRVEHRPGCGTEHHCDTNAAVNIRNRSLAWLEEVFAAAAEAKACEPAVNEARRQT